MNVRLGALLAAVVWSVAPLGARAEDAETERGSASAEATAIREQIDTADEKVDTAVERVQAEATHARAALGRVGATASRAPSRE